jgi:hypothetical protein
MPDHDKLHQGAIEGACVPSGPLAFERTDA